MILKPERTMSPKRWLYAKAYLFCKSSMSYNQCTPIVWQKQNVSRMHRLSASNHINWILTAASATKLPNIAAAARRCDCARTLSPLVRKASASYGCTTRILLETISSGTVDALTVVIAGRTDSGGGGCSVFCPAHRGALLVAWCNCNWVCKFNDRPCPRLA